MKYQKPNISIHHPSTGVALILNLIVAPEMPFAIQLTTPKRVIVARIGRADFPRIVGTTCSCNTAVFHLDLLTTGRLLGMTVTVAKRGPRVSHHLWGGMVRLGLGVGDVVGCSGGGGAGRVDVRSVAVGGCRVVVGPLVGVAEVSKRIRGSIETGMVVAAVGGVLVIGGVVVGAIGARVVGSGIVYRRLVGARCVADADAETDTVATRHDTGRHGAVWLLTGIAQDAALAVARGVDELVARLWVGLHCGDKGLFKTPQLTGGEARTGVVWTSKWCERVIEGGSEVRMELKAS